MKELDDVRADVSSGIDIQPVNDSDISRLKGKFRGPPGTPYEGGEFIVDIQIPVRDYSENFVCGCLHSRLYFDRIAAGHL